MGTARDPTGKTPLPEFIDRSEAETKPEVVTPMLQRLVSNATAIKVLISCAAGIIAFTALCLVWVTKFVTQVELATAKASVAQTASEEMERHRKSVNDHAYYWSTLQDHQVAIVSIDGKLDTIIKLLGGVPQPPALRSPTNAGNIPTTP